VRDYISDRVIMIAEYITENKATVRSAAHRFGISKSTVHKDMSERLMWLDRELFRQVHSVLEENKAERHIRGGMATKRKYAKSGM